MKPSMLTRIQSMQNGPYTDEELAIIHTNHDKMSRKELAKLLPDRSYCSVRSKVVELGYGSKLPQAERIRAACDKGDYKNGRVEDTKLTVIDDRQVPVPYGKATHLAVLCRCDCGVEKMIPVTLIRRRRAKSCGCLTAEKTSQRRKTHGMTNSRIYQTWCGMRSRCQNPNSQAYRLYGERGIRVCEEWQTSFEKFYEWASLNGYHDELEIDRIDYNGNYEPDNCRWVTLVEQANNTSQNRLLTVDGETKTAKEWTRDPRCSILYSTLLSRLDSGWDHEDAVLTPLLRQSYNHSNCT